MVTPRWSWLLTQWSLEPTIVVGLAVMSAAYVYAATRRPSLDSVDDDPASAKVTRFQWWMFALSILTLVIGLLSPLDYVSDSYLFSAHMIQHLLLATVWPPLLLLGLPASFVAPLFRSKLFGPVLRKLTLPAVAFVIFNVDITIWHLPAWYDLTLRNESIHIFEHLTFMAAGVLVWWPVLSPIRSHRLSYPGQVLYLFANLFPTMALGIFFSFYQHALYAPYVAAPRIWGISALTDQQIGGLVMWMPGNIPYALAMAVILVNWLDKGDPSRDRAMRPSQVAAGHREI